MINDLVANAIGISMLKKNDLVTLNIGKKRKGNAALISAGTGLGEAILFWDGKKYRPSPSEGGHVDFAPKGRLEMELLQFLLKRFKHVSYERILSGEGLFQIYQFLRFEEVWQGTPMAVPNDKKRGSRIRHLRGRPPKQKPIM